MHKPKKHNNNFNNKNHKELIEEATTSTTAKATDINEICERTTTNFAKSTQDNLNYQRDNASDEYNEAALRCGISHLIPYPATNNYVSSKSKESIVLNSRSSNNKESVLSNGVKSKGKHKKNFLAKMSMNESYDFNIKSVNSAFKSIKITKKVNNNNGADVFASKFFNERKMKFKSQNPKEMSTNGNTSQINVSNQHILNVSCNHNPNCNNGNSNSKSAKQHSKSGINSLTCCGVKMYLVIFIIVVILSIITLGVFLTIHFGFN